MCCNLWIYKCRMQPRNVWFCCLIEYFYYLTQVVGIPMGTNCAPLLADLFLYSYESEFLQKLVKDKKLEPLISHTGIMMTFYLSIILDLQNFFHWYILQSWKLKRPPIQLRPHHFWTNTSKMTTVVNSVLKFMISGTTSILKS